MNPKNKTLILIFLLSLCLFEGCIIIEPIPLMLLKGVVFAWIIIGCLIENPIIYNNYVVLGISILLTIFLTLFFYYPEIYQQLFPSMRFGWYTIIIFSLIVLIKISTIREPSYDNRRSRTRNKLNRKGSKSASINHSSNNADGSFSVDSYSDGFDNSFSDSFDSHLDNFDSNDYSFGSNNDSGFGDSYFNDNYSGYSSDDSGYSDDSGEGMEIKIFLLLFKKSLKRNHYIFRAL